MSPQEKPDRLVLNIWRISTLVSNGILGLFLFGLFGFMSLRDVIAPQWMMLGLLPVGLAMLTLLVLERQWEAWTFMVTPESLEMNHGWLWRQRRVVARDRIQHVDINSGPIDRRFGLVQVVVYTAGTTVGMIPGLKPHRAEQLRDELMAGRGVE